MNIGITRRIDELGRIVIPKEIRKNLKIKDNDQMEISIDDDKIVLSRYDVLKKDNVIKVILLCVKKLLNKSILYTSRDKIIDYCLVSKKNLKNIYLNKDISNIIENRKEFIQEQENISLTQEIDSLSCIIMPLIINGDLLGSIILYSEDNINNRDIEIMHFIKMFLELYLE